MSSKRIDDSIGKMLLTVDVERLERCFNPKSLAVVGGKEAEKVLVQCQKMGFSGDLWAINPKRASLAGIQTLSSVFDCPTSPDVVFLGIPAEPSITLVEELANSKVGGVICYASGFRELGEGGLEMQTRLIEAAGNMPVLGPNCHGYINGLSGAALWPEEHGLKQCKKGVAIISSSGNVSINMSFQQRALSIALLSTVGNQAVMGIEEILLVSINNPDITAIGLHIEGLKKLPLFCHLMALAKEKNKPVVVLKTGKSSIGASITMSHTATLAGESGLYDALFAKLGVPQVDTLECFLESLKLLSVSGAIRGNRLSSMSCSGGEASLIADLAVKRDLVFPALEEQHKISVSGTLNEYVHVENPLDYHTFIWGDYDKLWATFSAMLSGQFDFSLLILDFPVVNDCNNVDFIVAAEAFVAAVGMRKCQAAVVVSLPENISMEIAQMLINVGVAPLMGMESALAAVEVASKIYKMDSSNTACMQFIHGGKIAMQMHTCPKRNLTEYAAKQLLLEAGCDVPKSYLISAKEEGVKSVNLNYPLVAKAVGEVFLHKTELNAVYLNIHNQDALNVAIGALSKLSDKVMVEEMVNEVVAELLLCVSYDPQFGHYLVLGVGGTWVEVIQDRQILLFPITERSIEHALYQLKIAPILKGYRGKAGADIKSVIRNVLQVAELVAENRTDILEVEINPLMVRAENKGAFVADAFVTLVNLT